MPIVPTYDNFQAAPTGQPNARFTAPDMPDFAGQQTKQLGQGLSAAGGVIGKLAMEAVDEVNQVRTNDAMNRLVRARTDLQIEAMQLTGRAALERPDGKSLPDEYAERLDKLGQEVSAGLGNDNQRRAFAHQAGQLSNQFRGTLGTHMLQQHKQFKADTQNATVEEAQRQGGLLYGDAAVRAQSANAIRAVVDQIKTDNGWDAVKDKALIDQTLSKAMTPLHAAVMTGLLKSDNTEAARAYYDANSAELTTQARVQLHDTLNAGDFEKRTQTGAEDVLKQAEGDPIKALALAREKFSGKDEDAIVSRIKAFDAEKTTLMSRDAKRVGTEAWTSVMETGRIAPGLLTELRAKAPEEERQIRDWQEAKWRRAKADAEGAKTDGFDTYYGLRMMSANDPAAFSNLDLRKLAPMLGKQQLNHLVEVQAGISKGDVKAMESARMVKNTLSLIKTEVAAVGIDLTPKEGSPQAKATNQFMGALSMALDDAAKVKGSPLTPDESKRIGMSMVREGVEQGSGIFGAFQTKKRGYQIATDPSIKPDASFVAMRFGDIPGGLRDELTSEYRSRNGLGRRALSSDQEAEIERAYTRGVQQGRFK